MLGKVHGPYIRPDGIQIVIVVLHNEDGSIKSKTTIPYKKYLKEVKEGKHQYKQYQKKPLKLKPITKLSANSIRKIREFKNQQIVCSFCLERSKNQKFRYSYKHDLFFCNRNCQEKYIRRQNKKIKPIYYNQFVIPINVKKENKYYIIVENTPGQRIAYFILQDKCKTIITEDHNKVALYRLIYDISDAVKIKSVPGYKKYFWITESGLFISKRKKQILSQQLNSDTGYLTHSTAIGGRNGLKVNLRIHRLVGLAFIPNPENKPEINHIDGVKTNNHVSNLEWVTSKENSQHAVKTGLIVPKQGEDQNFSKLKNAEASEIRRLHQTNKYSRKELANMFNVSPRIIGDCIKWKTYRHV